jgi:hypothetical protein
MRLPGILFRANNAISNDIQNTPPNPEGVPQLVSHRMSAWPALAALIAILLLGLGVSQMGVGQVVLKKTGLVVGSPGTYTSLAFLDPQSLPTQIGHAGTRVNVSFVIRNATMTSREYQWTLLFIQGEHSRRVSAGELRVQSGREASVNKTIKISCQKGQVRINVSLAQPAQHIDAWMTCKA